MLFPVFLFLFLGLGSLICYQDLKARAVSLWLLVAYSLTCMACTCLLQGPYGLLANAVSALLYFGLLAGVLLLYYFFKEKKFSNLIDSRIGLADIILLLAIGVTLNMTQLILFFSVVFFISAVLGLLWFNPKKLSVPLAGILCPLHTVYYFLASVYSVHGNFGPG
jgi:hypothetical protein